MSIDNVYTRAQKHLDQELPFVLYRKANSDQLNAFFQESDIVYTIEKGYSDAGFVFAPFDALQQQIIIPVQYSDHHSVTVEKNAKSSNVRTPLEHIISDKEIQKNHEDLVQKAIDAIKTKGIKKIVVSRKEEVKIADHLSSLQIFDRLLHTYSNAFVYLWYHPKIGTWLGATPETLLQVQDRRFSTMALAGTQPNVNGKEKVEWGSKELEEQQLVTDFILEKVTPLIDDIQSSEAYTHQAATLLHIRTDIKGVIKDTSTVLKSIISALHPTPAVCGFPRDKAFDFILKEEGYDRSYYTGFLGELNINNKEQVNSDLFVNLRCMQLKQDKAIIYVGGGITKDSIPEKEWQETIKKTATMKKVLFQ
ncbi:chorismate-binding protein [Aquimarina algicola]|uniref:isochorismate synthase n=1 Tax=Aquimarina algicola TaxID=2589995 RepID=A0A504JDD6_9FLAO|nr:chorismate-binding protein [Aquimarina algicola]TPN89036.1 isochorismate synthase [Aquimarina algicola]